MTIKSKVIQKFKAKSFIQHQLRTKIVGSKIYHLKEVESTMDEAKKLAGGREGLTIIAERQVKGRGRLGRVWHSPLGGIYLSIVLKPPASSIPCLPLLGGLAVAETLRDLYRIDARLKWPNDVTYQNRKLGGILLESKIESNMVHHVILGIGVNLNIRVSRLPENLKNEACSVMELTGKKVSKNRFVRELLKRLDIWYNVLISEGCKPLLKAWSRLSETLGRKVKVYTQSQTIKGIAEKIGSNGALILRLPVGTRTKIFAEEVKHLREENLIVDYQAENKAFQLGGKNKAGKNKALNR